MAEDRARAELERTERPALPPRGGRRRAGPAGGLVRCVTGKSGFSEAEARRRLEEYTALAEGSRRTGPRRVYPCDKCGSWHLTREEKR